VTSSDFTSLSTTKRLNFDHFHGYADEVPWLLVDFRYALPGGEATQTQVMVIVDSGSAITYLPKLFAYRLHVPLDRSTIVYKPGAGGTTFPCYATVWDLRAYLCGEWVTVRTRFFASEAKGGALLGRQGAFEALQLAFMHGQRRMYAALATPTS
jgi:hypothetical protein